MALPVIIMGAAGRMGAILARLVEEAGGIRLRKLCQQRREIFPVRKHRVGIQAHGT